MKRAEHQPEDKIHPKNARRPNKTALPHVSPPQRTTDRHARDFAGRSIALPTVPSCPFRYP
jgi:hypothetical protein